LKGIVHAGSTGRGRWIEGGQANYLVRRRRWAVRLGSGRRSRLRLGLGLRLLDLDLVALDTLDLAVVSLGQRLLDDLLARCFEAEGSVGGGALVLTLGGC
jgi:hypothetical protein